ncbi:MAG: caspase family protein [Treponema sp.]|jgi:hypothetical protein|nr:caspase family protein [Treponema sp.]
MKTLCTVLFFLTAAFSFGQQKYALVIGNADYTGISKLNNPVNDANDISAALQGIGFTVEKVLNGNLEQMESAVMRLKNLLSVSKNAYGFLFYAGHGVQSGGVNYLIPVGANIPGENFLRDRAVSVQTVLNELNDAKNELNIVVLDACRDNPFSWNRSGSRGLSTVTHQPADSIIVYATGAGSTADDGTGRNGLFTSQLLKNIASPGIEVKEMFNKTGADVSQASSRRQIPAIYSQFFGTAYLHPRSSPSPVPNPTPQQSVRDQLVNATGTATVTVTQDTAFGESFALAKAASITLRGNTAARTIRGTAEETFVSVGKGVTLTLENITLTGIHIQVEGGGTLVMNDSAAINGCSKYAVVIDGGTFTMNGGRITANGGGGQIDGGVIVMDNGFFSMKGGYIENNRGKGVLVNDSTFTMSNGTISGNASPSGGGGVQVMTTGKFTMSGGTIAGNRTTGGGGVLVDTVGSFSKTGGTIYGSDGGSNGNYGSGKGDAVLVFRPNDNHVMLNNTVGPNSNLNY